MADAPRTALEAPVGGYNLCRIFIEDPGNTINTGQRGLQVEVELSEDDGQTWRLYSTYLWQAGQRLTAKSQARWGKHYIEERSMNYRRAKDENGRDIIITEPTRFPQGWRFRWSGRHTGDGTISFTAQLE